MRGYGDAETAGRGRTEEGQVDDHLTDRLVQGRSQRAGERRDISDISALPTHHLLHTGQGLALQPVEPAEPDGLAEPQGAVAGSDLLPPQSGRQRLRGADTYEQEAARLQALAQVMERHLRVCSAQLEKARERYHQLQTTVGASGTTGTTTAAGYDLEQARLDMESYVLVLIQLREDYRAFMHRADQHLAAAAMLRGEECE